MANWKLALVLATLVAPGAALAGNTTSAGITAVAGSVGSLAGGPVGSCVPGTVNGVSVPGC